MCHECRAKIRAKAITHFFNTSGLPVEQREAFELGAHFGELNAALFLEHEASYSNAIRAKGVMVAQLEALLGAGVIVTGVDAYQQSAEDLLISRALNETVAFLEQEGLVVTYGKPSLRDANNYNSVRKIHELPAKTLDTSH